MSLNDPTKPFHKRIIATLAVLYCAVSPAFGLVWAPEGSTGGTGNWDAITPNWLDGAQQVAFPAGADPVFSEPAGTVEIDGAIEAGEVLVEDAEYLFVLDNDSGDQLAVSTFTGQARIGFSGLINSGADSYPPLSSLRSVGLSIRPTGVQRLEAEILPILGGSPVLSVLGNAGRLEFAGTWNSDSGTIIPWVRLEDGGHLVLTESAEMYFIKEGFFTLQLWVNGDGSGSLELAEGFVADHTEGGLVRKGLGSIRMGAGTLISHHSQNLPLGYRPRADGTAQSNGHLVFENSVGSRWITRSNDQVYPGAVWIFKSMEVVTETDLMHVGLTEGSSNYTAWNGWSVLKGATVTKRGAGTLTLAGEQSYAAGANLKVEEGTLSLQSDPSSGASLGGTVTGAQLTLQVAEGAALEWQTDGAIQSLFLNGRMGLNGELRLENGGLGVFGANSLTEVLLSEDPLGNRVLTDSFVTLGGTLVVHQLPWQDASPGTEWVLCQAGSLMGAWTLDDRTGLDLQLVQDATSLKVVVGAEATGLAGDVFLADEFNSDSGQWDDLSTVPLWGSPRANGSAFEWVDGVVRLKRSGDRNTAAYTRYDKADGLKTFTALDFQFPESVDHAGSEVTIDFRLRWPTVTDGSGEGGRFIVLLNHEYPEGGLDLTPEGEAGSKVSDFSSDWWARPAYHVRLRNSTTRAGSTFLQYGGGATSAGEYEATANWWLPGFVSGAGQLAPGAGDDYPENSWVRTREGMARDSFTSFRYRILPDRQELWRDDNDDGFISDDELKATMPLPENSTAPLYQYFTTFEGIRVFWNGVSDGAGDSGQVELDWLSVVVQDNVSPVAEAGEAIFAQQLVEGLASVVLDASGSTDPEGEPLLYAWLLEGEFIAVSRSPATQLQLPLGEHVLDLLVVDSSGSYAFDTVAVTVTVGKARPLADAGPNQSVTAINDWFGVVTVSGAGSFSPTSSLIRYRWSTGIDDRLLYEGPLAQTELALPVGTHVLTLTVWDEDELFTQATTRIIVDPIDAGSEPQVIYRENFSRPGSGGEMGPWAVGWDLMRFDGDPVASISWDGNAHRSLSWDSYGNAPYVTKINADPSGTEFDTTNSGGHMWMNQMPYYVASPGEWMLWTEEFAIDQADWELARLTFNAKDGSPERVKVAPAVRIDGQWYIGWDLRLETQWNYWRFYTLDLARAGWVRFEPSITFSVLDADPVERLPDGIISAFGIYMYKDYAWYVNEIDNISVYVVPAAGEDPYGKWVARSFPQAVLTDPAQSAAFAPEADPDRNGWSNIWEFAMGRRPLDASAPDEAVITFIDDTWLVHDIPFNPEATNLQLDALMSNDLQNWSLASAVRESYTHPESGQPRMRWMITYPASGTLFLQVVPSFIE